MRGFGGNRSAADHLWITCASWKQSSECRRFIGARKELCHMTSDTFLLFRDRRGGWCAAPPPFRNILSHPVGLGKTQAEAVLDLLGDPEFVHRGLSGEWPLNPD